MNEALARWGRIGDYISLSKPKTLLLHLPIVVAASVLATGALAFSSTLFAVILGGGLLAGSANALNCYCDRDVDATMPRTKNRAIPSGRINALSALRYGKLLGILGFIILWISTGLVVSALALVGFFSYVVIYTQWLKRRTFFSSIVGSLAGAMPPVVTWVAITGSLTTTPLLLATVVILWTPPHYWALALHRRSEYEHSEISALPNKHTAIWLLFFSASLIFSSSAMGKFIGLGSWYYLIVVPAGIAFLYIVGMTLRNPRENSRFLFRYSILYLILVFVALIIGRIVQ